VGGKWTSFRAFSEQATDLILEKLAVPRKISTRQLPIGGGKGYPKSEEVKTEWLCAASEITGVPMERMEILLNRYGTRALEVARFISEGQDQPLHHLPSFSHREILFLLRYEKVIRLEDLVRRRSNMMKLGQLSSELVEELAQILQRELGWFAERRVEEIALVCKNSGEPT
jgi:glycerol-3-phosphate dehydrogenase